MPYTTITTLQPHNPPAVPFAAAMPNTFYTSWRNRRTLSLTKPLPGENMSARPLPKLTIAYPSDWPSKPTTDSPDPMYPSSKAATTLAMQSGPALNELLIMCPLYT